LLGCNNNAFQVWSPKKHPFVDNTGHSAEWLNYMAFLEQALTQYGTVDGVKNSWEFDRWFTSEGSRQWSLVSDGSAVRVGKLSCFTEAHW
tara:strand:- start:408 stop:677 length:270 start_codon:yes stop_codon:yes gene_type:complete